MLAAFSGKQRGAGDILGQFLFLFQNPLAVRAVCRGLGCAEGRREQARRLKVQNKWSLFHGSPACLFV